VSEASLVARILPSVFMPPLFQTHPQSKDGTVVLIKTTAPTDFVYPTNHYNYKKRKLWNRYAETPYGLLNDVFVQIIYF